MNSFDYTQQIDIKGQLVPTQLLIIGPNKTGQRLFSSSHHLQAAYFAWKVSKVFYYGECSVSLFFFFFLSFFPIIFFKPELNFLVQNPHFYYKLRISVSSILNLYTFCNFKCPVSQFGNRHPHLPPVLWHINTQNTPPLTSEL